MAVQEGLDTGDYATNSLNQYTTQNIPGDGSNSLTYDADGNLTGIIGVKNVKYSWNAENRLIKVEPDSPVSGDKKVEFVYDYVGRRVKKSVSTWNGSSYAFEYELLFVYNLRSPLKKAHIR